MKTKEGKNILDCSMSGNCGTCMFFRTWLNTKSLKEFDEPYCCNSKVLVEEKEQN